MVTYGPWQESRIHEELFTLKDSSATDKVHELLGAAPTVRSGWDASNLAALSWSVLAGKEGVYEQDATDPPAADPSLSAAAYAEAIGTDVLGTAGALQHHMLQTGDQLFSTPPPQWRQEQRWTIRGASYRLWYDADLESGTGTTIYAVPAGMDPFTDEYYVELETAGAAQPLELVEVSVLATGGGVYRLHVKDAGVTAAPFLYSAAAQGGATTSIVEARTFPTADSGLTLDHGVLNDLADNATPYAGDWSLDGRMPTMAVLYNGPDLSTATLGGAAGTDALHEGTPVQIRIRYRWPRWRQVFYDVETVPHRRIYPRDDALAGGPGRNYPRPRSVQSSNRTSGYL